MLTGYGSPKPLSFSLRCAGTADQPGSSDLCIPPAVVAHMVCGLKFPVTRFVKGELT